MCIIYKDAGKILKKGGERKMKNMLTKLAVILALTFVFTPFSNYRRAEAAATAGFDVWKAVTNVISSVYDSLGRLIGQTQSVISNGVDLDGNKYTTTDTTEFKVDNGKAYVKTKVTETTSSSLNNDGSYYHSKQTINYIYDENNRLMGATGTQDVDGQEPDYYTDRKFFLDHGGAAGDILESKGAYDVNKDGKIDDNEKDVVLVKGGKFSGKYTLEFKIIEGEPYVSKRVGDITYKNSSGQERFTRHIETTYEYDVKGGKVLLTDTYTTQTDTYPETYKYTTLNKETGVQTQVPSGTKLFRSQYIHTHNDYNDDGSLKKTTGTGYGWGLINTSDGYMVYTSNITVEYEIKNGVARQTKFTETSYYVPAENSPPVVDPQGTGKVLGMFDIRSSDQTQGGNRGESNDYTYFIVQDDQGKVYLLRARTRAGKGNVDQNGNPDQTTLVVKEKDKDGKDKYIYNVGDTVNFEGEVLSGQGDQTANRIWRLTRIVKQQ